MTDSFLKPQINKHTYTELSVKKSQKIICDWSLLIILKAGKTHWQSLKCQIPFAACT